MPHGPIKKSFLHQNPDKWYRVAVSQLDLNDPTYDNLEYDNPTYNNQTTETTNELLNIIMSDPVTSSLLNINTDGIDNESLDIILSMLLEDN